MNIICFLKSMLKWARSGFKLVTYYEYWRRRQICNNCSYDSKRCPICGCWLWGYCRIKTSSCKHWKDYDDPWDLIDFRLKPTEYN